MANVKKTTTLICLLLVAGCAGVDVPSNTADINRESYTIEQNNIGEFVFCLNDDCQAYERKTLADIPAYVPPASVSVERQPNRADVRVFFNLGSSRLGAEAIKTLRELLPKLKNTDTIYLRGWADSRGGRNTAINRKLSRQRAQVIKRWLLKHGIRARITTQSQPACCNQDNTRVVVITW